MEMNLSFIDLLRPSMEMTLFYFGEEEVKKAKANERLARKLQSKRNLTEETEKKTWYGAKFSTTMNPNDRIEKHYDRWEAVAQDISSDTKECEPQLDDFIDQDDEDEAEMNSEERNARRKEEEDRAKKLILSGKLQDPIDTKPHPLHGFEPPKMDFPSEGQIKQGDDEGSDVEKPDKVYFMDRKKAMEEGIQTTDEQPYHDPGFQKWLMSHPKRDVFAASIADQVMNQTEDIPSEKELKRKISFVERRGAAKRNAYEEMQARIKEGKKRHVESWKKTQAK
ncbi:hypothetical protein AAMO2058_001649700 [Amorphochlora amoebiformis]